jgi:pseudouridine 5'-phosphatase
MGRSSYDSAFITINSFDPPLPFTPDSFNEALDAEKLKVFPNVLPMPGAVKLIQHLKENKIPIAVATSSKRRYFDIKTSNLPQLFGHFEKENVVVGDDKRIKVSLVSLKKEIVNETS